MASGDERTRTSDDRLHTQADGEPSAVLDVGSSLGRYEIVGRLGVGGMGVVYRARDPALDRELAIKVVHADGGADGQARLLREAQAMARLRRPGVVPVFDVGTVGDGVFVVMPYLAGGTLGAWLAAAPRSWREVLDRFVAAGRGLAVAHAAGLVHRDFKPDNVLLDEHGEIAVADFGLARPAHTLVPDDELVDASRAPPSPRVDVTRAGAVVGTPAYMAPEQLRGEPVDARADVFSFCASLYQGLCGQRPFATTTDGAAAIPELLDAVGAGRVRPSPADRDVPAWLRAACVRGLAADPAARWPSIDALLAHLERRRRRPRRVLIAAALTLAVAGAIAAVLAMRGSGREAALRFTERHITVAGDARLATLSPDGRHIAVLAGDELRVVEAADPGVMRSLATGTTRGVAALDAPLWTADGREIVYQRRGVGWNAVALDGAVRPYFTTSGAVAPTRDGGMIVYRLPEHAIAIHDAHGGTRTCAVPGDYVWLMRVVAARTSDDVYVFASSGVDLDRIYRTDLRCSAMEALAPGVTLASVTLAADGAGLIGLARRGDQTEVVAIDRGGRVRSLDMPLRSHIATVVGEERGGAVLVVDGQEAWRIVRVDRQGKSAELAAGTLTAQLAIDPGATRFALIESAGRTSTLRAGLLARPQALGPVLDRAAISADWSPDGSRIALISRADGPSRLVLMDPDGGHRSERVVADASAEATVAWLTPGLVAYRLRGNAGFAVVDLATGARHDLFDRSAGWAFDLGPSPSGGLMWLWNRRPAQVWTAAADGSSPRMVPSTPIVGWLGWSTRGAPALIYDLVSPTVDRLDLDTGAIEPYVTLPGETGATNQQVFALPGGDVLVLRALSVTDAIRLSPEP